MYKVVASIFVVFQVVTCQTIGNIHSVVHNNGIAPVTTEAALANSIAVNGYNPAINGYNPAINGYNPAINGYNPAINGYNPAINGYNPAINGYNPAINGYNPAINGYNPAINGYNPAINGYNPAINAYAPVAQACKAGINYGLNIAELGASRGPGLRVSSVSPISPSGVTVESESILMEGPVRVAGSLPFLGVVSMDGPLPAAGVGTVAYNCGNGNVGIVNEGPEAAGVNLPGLPTPYTPLQARLVY